MSINPGRLRETVELQSPPATDDGAGGQTGGWTLVKSLRAEVLPLRGNEAAQAAVATGFVQYRVTIRRRAIDSGQRLIWGTQMLDIRAVLPQSDRRWTVLLCDGKAL